MYNILNDHCEFCKLESHDEIDSLIKQEKPKWFSPTGQIKRGYQPSYNARRHDEFFRRDKGPCLVWESFCSECGIPLKICAKHLRDILTELEGKTK